jgi:hypothetical protein
MAIDRAARRNNETVNSINDIEEYINETYLQQIQNKINELKIKRDLITNKIAVYTSLNNTNNNIIQALNNDVKYTTIKANQLAATTAINNINRILKDLTIILSYKDQLTINNLSYQQELYSGDKVSITNGEFIELQVATSRSINEAINIAFIDTEVLKLEQPPTPLQPLKYLATDAVGNLIWV